MPSTLSDVIAIIYISFDFLCPEEISHLRKKSVAATVAQCRTGLAGGSGFPSISQAMSSRMTLRGTRSSVIRTVTFVRASRLSVSGWGLVSSAPHTGRIVGVLSLANTEREHPRDRVRATHGDPAFPDCVWNARSDFSYRMYRAGPPCALPLSETGDESDKTWFVDPLIR